MAYNKIIYKGETLIDLTDLDVTEEDVAQGKTFIKANGVKSTGTSTGSSSSGKLGEYVSGSITEVSASDLNGISMIRAHAFNGCRSLASITIPDSVTSIGYKAFYGCNNLTDVYYYGNQSSWNSISIGSSNTTLTNATIHFIGKTESYNNVETRTESNSTGTTLYIITNS